MSVKRFPKILISILLILVNVASAIAMQSQSNIVRKVEDSPAKTSAPQSQQNEATASETARKMRRTLPVIPSLVRGVDGILNLNGQRATQSSVVSSTNVKDPVTDAFVFTGGLPVEAAEAVRIPPDQFSASQAKFYATVPAIDFINPKTWHFSAGVPFFALQRGSDGFQGIRSASPSASATGSVFGGKVALFESFEHRLSKTTIANLDEGSNDTEFRSYDLNNRAEVKLWNRHTTSGRLALFSQKIDSATLSALVFPEAAADYFMAGGQLSFSDTFTAKSGLIFDSSLSFKKLRVRLLPHGNGPMTVIEQGETLGNYFDALRRNASRFEWRESARLPTKNALGKHQISLSGSFARSAYEATHIGSQINLAEEEGNELFATIGFTGSTFESQSARELTAWVSDEWSPARRASFTLAARYDRTTLSRMNQWSPRFGFAFLPFKNGRTVVRGGAGIFYDILPLTAGVFPRSRQRVVQFFDEGEPLAEPRVLENLVTSSPLKTAYLFGWNLEVDHQLAKNFFLRLRGEDRRGRNQLLLAADRSGTQITALVLSDNGTSRSRELETTLSFRPTDGSTMNFSYIRSSAFGDLSGFASQIGTFEKNIISKNQYAHSRSDAPHRFVYWGNINAPGGFVVAPSLDLHSGFPFAFTDAGGVISGIQDFGRYPRLFSLDLGLYKDIKMKSLDQRAKVRVGVSAYNLTNHFNPRQVLLGEDESQHPKRPVFVGFLDGVARTYRANLVFSF